MIIIDQHAAHERILYEQLKAAYLQVKNRQPVISLTKPKTLSLPISQAEILSTHLETLEKLGFTLQRNTTTNFHITAIPKLFADRNILQLFQEIIADLEGNQASTAIDKHTNRMLAFLACRMAIKGGDPLNEDLAQKLITDLTTTKSNFTCPHGRPSHIEFSLAELEKAFGRI